VRIPHWRENVWNGRVVDREKLRYRLPKPLANGQTELIVTPLELLERLALLIPPADPSSPLLWRTRAQCPLAGRGYRDGITAIGGQCGHARLLLAAQNDRGITIPAETTTPFYF
jgi:hypothetical protein